jgi:DNA-binding CsgD family transcriptional regulator
MAMEVEAIDIGMESVMSKERETNRAFKDPSALTAYEEKIWALHKEGKTSVQIAAEIGAKNYKTILSRIVIIREKLGASNG